MATQDEIRVRAYYLWEAKGQPSDSALEDWLEAERSFTSQRSALRQAVLSLSEALGPRRLPPHVDRVEAAAPPDAPPAKKPVTRSRKKVSVPV